MDATAVSPRKRSPVKKRDTKTPEKSRFVAAVSPENDDVFGETPRASQQLYVLAQRAATFNPAMSPTRLSQSGPSSRPDTAPSRNSEHGAATKARSIERRSNASSNKGSIKPSDSHSQADRESESTDATTDTAAMEYVEVIVRRLERNPDPAYQVRPELQPVKRSLDGIIFGQNIIP